ncbi:ABC transporter ATP-binding protein [Shewanella dokdonensis]|uniref:ABC transporter ATP-binding protein n=1 Tax=Shewanella dokdonensis TaxID=712036 RepID=A0ABX8DH62_9GAMM|nr:ABC transporter ATP-binding protein [Shewanella dokdonensis]MCL1074407.1 ABC transporter ATP-binding protein [Shewanella dokdonensis]QVK24078.1 ABC transporter ATP-binding protein [Shewanella dokdonensis]
MEPALKADNICWSVAGKPILSGVSFSLPKGQVLGLIGPNGAGKSSLLRCLYRYIQPDTGNILLHGDAIDGMSLQTFARQVAVVQQDMPLASELSLRQLVATGLTPYKRLFERNSAEDNNAVDAALAQVGLHQQAEAMFRHLSGGEKQRALIARAIVQKPALLLLDEPTNHLDIRYQIQILELVRSLGVSVIASIHDLNLAAAMCDELLLLHQGRVIAAGDAATVLTEQRVSEVFGVCCQISRHSQTGKPLLQYFYGYAPPTADKTDAVRCDNGVNYAAK